MKTPLFILFLLGSSFVGMSQTLYVDSSAALGGNGGSWSTAFTELSDALDSAWHNPAIDEVFVAKGTYHPDRFLYEMNGARIGVEQTSLPYNNITFHVRTGLELLGGFPSGGGTRNPSLYTSTLDGKLVGGDSSYRVVYIDSSVFWNAINDSTVIDGFSIRYGAYKDNFNANIRFVNGVLGSLCGGAGISVYGGVTRISNNRVHHNIGSVGLENARGVLLKNSITDNYSIQNWGNYGGVRIIGSGWIVKENVISKNTGIYVGGLSHAGGGTIHIEDNIIEDNKATFTGGCRLLSDSAIVKGNMISGNNRYGVYAENARIVNNFFSDNESGAVYGLSNGTVVNNVFYKNKATIGIGASISIFTNDVIVANNTFISDTAYSIKIYDSSEAKVYNNIFFGSRGDFNRSHAFPAPLRYVFKNNSLQFFPFEYNATSNNELDSNSTGNIFRQTPFFKDINDPLGPDNIFGTADDGLQLYGNSPCIGAGNSSLIPSGITTDVTGAPRIENGIVNMGAYESKAWPLAIQDIDARERFEVYPNPTSEYLNIEVEGEREFIISDMLGNQIRTIKVKKGSTQFDISSLASGAYFIQMKNGEKSWSMKFIKI